MFPHLSKKHKEKKLRKASSKESLTEAALDGPDSLNIDSQSLGSRSQPPSRPNTPPMQKRSEPNPPKSIGQLQVPAVPKSRSRTPSKVEEEPEVERGVMDSGRWQNLDMGVLVRLYNRLLDLSHTTGVSLPNITFPEIAVIGSQVGRSVFAVWEAAKNQ